MNPPEHYDHLFIPPIKIHLTEEKSWISSVLKARD